jgi:hypothetical protein
MTGVGHKQIDTLLEMGIQEIIAVPADFQLSEIRKNNN